MNIPATTPHVRTLPGPATSTQSARAATAYTAESPPATDPDQGERRSRSGAELAESCQGLVRSIAWQIHRRLPPNVELDDLIAYGQLGVSQAARDYDATRGTSFTTFAYYRIRGAILDGLSEMSWFSRADYHARKFERLGADALEVTVDDGHGEAGGVCGSRADLEREAMWFGRASGALAIAYLAGLPGAEDMLEDPAAAAPEQDVIGRELVENLHDLIEALPGDAGELIRMTYFEDLTLQEAANRLGISKSWASRLHAKTLHRLARGLHLLGALE